MVPSDPLIYYSMRDEILILESGYLFTWIDATIKNYPAV